MKKPTKAQRIERLEKALRKAHGALADAFNEIASVNQDQELIDQLAAALENVSETLKK